MGLSATCCDIYHIMSIRLLTMALSATCLAHVLMFTHNEYNQQIRLVNPMPDYCWPTVYAAGPTIGQHWVNILCFLGRLLTISLSATCLAHVLKIVA